MARGGGHVRHHHWGQRDRVAPWPEQPDVDVHGVRHAHVGGTFVSGTWGGRGRVLNDERGCVLPQRVGRRHRNPRRPVSRSHRCRSAPSRTALAADPDANLDLLVELVDLDQAAWTPTIEEISTPTEASGAGILLARKAADDLAVGVGDTIVLRHPIRTDIGGFALAETELVVRGIHANPIRTFAFMDLDDAGQFGLVGAVNLVQAYPPKPPPGLTSSVRSSALLG